MKKEGSIMANRNGMGPMNEGPLSGRGMGNCSSKAGNIAKVGMAVGAGLGMAWGCRRRFRMNEEREEQAETMVGGRGMGRRSGLAGRGAGQRRRPRR